MGVRVPPFAESGLFVSEQKSPPTLKEIHVTVPEEDIKRKKEEILRYFRNRAEIPGFRPGNAPLELVERFYKERIEERLSEELIQEYGKKAILEAGMNPLHPPYVTNFNFNSDGTLSFSLSFEVMPNFDVKDYEGVSVEIEKKKIREGDVELALQELRERLAELVPVENREVQKGDIIEMEIQRKILSEKRTLPVERFRWQVENEIEEIPGIFENVIGMRKNEEKIFKILYPEDFPKKNLRGKEIETKINVVSIKEKRPPELTDEYVSQIGDYKDLQDLKEKLRQNISEALEKKEREMIESEILKKLREKNPLDVPLYLEKLEMERLASSIQISGGISEEEKEKIIEAIRARAKENVMNFLILKKISEKENIKVEKREVELEARKRTDLNSLSMEELEDLKKEIEKNMILRKTLDFVINKAIIKYKEENQ